MDAGAGRGGSRALAALPCRTGEGAAEIVSRPAGSRARSPAGSDMQSVTKSKGIGASVRRKEDARLVVGAGCFSDDVDLPRQARAFVIRSVHAHARIRSIDAARA